MNFKRINDMAARNVAGIKNRRQNEDKAKQDKIDNLCEEIVESIAGNITKEQYDNQSYITDLCDMFDTMNLIEEEGFGNELGSFIKNYKELKFDTSKRSIERAAHDSTIVFKLPDDIEGDWSELEITLSTWGSPKVKLYGAGQPWVDALKPMAQAIYLNQETIDNLIEDIETFGSTLDVLAEDFFVWVGENFPEVV